MRTGGTPVPHRHIYLMVPEGVILDGASVKYINQVVTRNNNN
jgi:hypothetical protein